MFCSGVGAPHFGYLRMKTDIVCIFTHTAKISMEEEIVHWLLKYVTKKWLSSVTIAHAIGQNKLHDCV